MKTMNTKDHDVKVCGDNGYCNQQAEYEAKLQDEWDSFGDASLPSTGKHTVLLASREMIPEKQNEAGEVIAQRHIKLVWQDVSNGCFIEARLYGGAVPYFMANINRQLDGALMGMKLSQILDYVRTHTIDIWVDFAGDYGIRVNYFMK